MKLFKDKVNEKSCSCGDTSDYVNETSFDAKILGTGCAKCNQLAENTKNALSELGLPTDIEKVTSLPEIAKYGVMSTPALVYKNQVISYGKVLTVEQIKKLLSTI